MARGLALVTIGGLAACGGSDAVMTDAGNAVEDAADPVDSDASTPDAPFGIPACWPTMERHPTTGFARLGAGDSFTSMPGELPLAYGPQGGFMVFVNVHMSGFAPGNPRVLFDPGNPRTRIRAYFADTNVPMGGGCNFDPYEPSPAGGFELGSAIPLIFDTCWRSDWLINARMRIDLEVLDPTTGAYGTDSKVVTVTDSPGAGYPIEEGTAPCPVSADGPPPVTPLVKQPAVEIRTGS